MSSLIQQALFAHRNNNLSKAEQLYLNEIQLTQSYEAMQLLGSLYSSQNNFEKAEHYLLASLAKNNKQPHTFNNLGLCYKKQRKFAHAIQAFNNTLLLAPQNESPYVSLIDCLISQNTLAAAENKVTQSLQKFPQSHKLYNLLGRIHYKNNHLIAAEKAFQTSLSLKPNYAIALNNISHVYRDSHKFTEAINSLLKALSLKPNSAEIHFNLGNIFAEKADFPSAIKHYKSVLTVNPYHKKCLRNINSVYWSLNNKREFLSDYESLASEHLMAYDLLYDYVEFLIQSNQFGKSDELIENNKDFVLQNPKLLTLLARLEDKKGNLTTSEKHWLRCCELTDYKIPSYCFELIIIYLRQHNHISAKSTLFLALEHNPKDIGLLSLETNIYRITGCHKSDPAGFDDRLVREFNVNIIDSAFENKALLDNLKTIHSSTVAPVDQTLVNGVQTPGNLIAFENQLDVPFFELIKPFLEQYIRENRDKVLSLSSASQTNYNVVGAWSVLLETGGYHTMHIHPEGDLSAVYYVDLPDEVNDEQKQTGWIKFGEPNFQHPELSATQFIQPKVGKLVVFPSYFWHGTIPFESQQQRATIAFDIKVEQ